MEQVVEIRRGIAGDREILGSTRVTGNIVSKQISFILKPDDNGAEYRCNATNAATTEPLLATKTLTVNCESMLGLPNRKMRCFS